jgi:adenylate cyclase
MGPEAPQIGRRLAAIFAADAAGYSRLMGQDEAGTLRALSAARAIMDRRIAEHGGRTVNSVGDSVLAEFPSAVSAVKCAMAVQEGLAQADAESAHGPRLLFRIAVHVGDVLTSGADIYGDGINVSARLQEVAEPGGVCISDAAYSYVRKVLPVVFDDLGERTLKNIDEPVRVFAVRPAKGIEYSSPTPKLPPAPPPRQKRRTVGWTAGGIAALLAIFLVYEFAPMGDTQASQFSVAVLPFANLSGDPTQEFFSDGMTEEITSALAKVPDLHVVGRTSAFQFKGQNRDLRAIGQALSVTHLIEGSVRKAGDRLRITAQLIAVADGTHFWAENYDRQLTDVFAIQADVATAIAGALRTPLRLKPGERLLSDQTIDPESFEQYLRRRA